MSIYTLQNEDIAVGIAAFGAELKSLKDLKTGREYMWNAQPEFWKRTSPVLFPLVGSLKNKSYWYQGKTYEMSQHGFARDMEFCLLSKSDTEVVFALEDNVDTYAMYPFKFHLEISYRLEARKVVVGWKVLNTDNKDLWFSIGGHPAFLCSWAHENCYLSFDTDSITCTSLNEKGLASSRKYKLDAPDGILPITEKLLSKDALVVENNQAHRVSLLGKDKKAYLTVEFDAPLFGIWSPPGKNAPFICIEPWFGRCDGEHFNGSIEEREWGNRLHPNSSFVKEYSITI